MYFPKSKIFAASLSIVLSISVLGQTSLVQAQTAPLMLSELPQDVPQPLIVTSLADTVDAADGVLTLREAIDTANRQLGADTIRFAPELSGTIKLSGTQLVIQEDLTIEGGASKAIEISGEGASRIFLINNPVTANLNNLSLLNGISRASQNGYLSTRETDGGAILNLGRLTLNSCILKNNTAVVYGGAVFSYSTLTVAKSEFSDNRAVNGGAISTSAQQGQIQITDSRFVHNVANANGGAILGMGPHNVTITNSTLEANTAVRGGGIMLMGSMVQITNSTLSQNSANYGGAVFNVGALSVTHSTIVGNNARIATGGIWSRETDGDRMLFTNLRGSIIAQNWANASKQPYDLEGWFNSQGYNLIGNRGNAVIGSLFQRDNPPGDQVGSPENLLDPKLDVLQDNGGATWTMALLVGSPAINGVRSGLAPSTDQRGIPRRDGFADIGAVEYGRVTPPILEGARGADTLTGTDADDRINGKAGNDVIDGKGGNDILNGDSENDTLYGGAEDDTLNGGSQDDVLIGGQGKDFLIGGTGNDRYVYTTLDEAGDTIQDFMNGNDVLDLRELFRNLKYQGTDAISNSYLRLISNAGKTEVQIDPDGTGVAGFTALVTLNGIAPNQLTIGQNLLTR